MNREDQKKMRTAIKVWNGPKYKPGWMRMLKNCGHSARWNELAVNPMLLVRTRKRVNTFFMTVQRRVLRAAGVFATTVKRGSQGKKINQKITLPMWQRPWVLNS